MQKGMNLFPAGVIDVLGAFSEGQLISIIDIKSVIIGIGISTYDSEEVLQIKPHHSSQITEVIGKFYGNAIIPRQRFWLAKDTLHF